MTGPKEASSVPLPPTARWVLGAVFLMLLGLMIGSGLAALHDLKRMHVQEQTARRLMAERAQALSSLSVSIQVFGETAQHLTMSPGQESEQQIRSILDELQRQVASDFARYPSAAVDPLQVMRGLFEQQTELFDSMLARPPEERRRRGPEWVEREVAPLQIQILQRSNELRAWNERELRLTDQALMAQFDELESSLTRSFLIALGSGLLLILASMVYIQRLETQTRRRYAELAKSRGELEQLSNRLVDAQETERRNISRELHDEVGQTMGALLVDFGRLAAALPEAAPQLKNQVEHMKGVAERCVRAVRNLALLLRPSMLDDLGLVAALEWQGREVSRNSAVEVDVQSENVSDELPDEYKVCVYRLVQEALNNCVRHAGARNARVRVEQGDGRIVVTVTDDGHGFDAQRSRGVGILGMEERVRRLGGSFRIESAPGQPTTVRAELPI